MTFMEEVTLEQVLAARETRVREQDRLLTEYRAPVISFTMNIPGPIKDTRLIRRAFFAGCNALRTALETAGFPMLGMSETLAATGCELRCAVRADATAVKRICVAIEDADELGRLFDMDVLAPDGAKLNRKAVNGGERNCIVCGAKGRGCASRRVHSVSELQAATRRILETHFAASDRHFAAELVTHALLDEVYTTPKPGLVDRSNNGSHRDMSVETFERSAAALTPYWERCVEIGQMTANELPETTFSQLRTAGLDAENAMFAATGGVNTHKGAIFTLGTVCGALGRLWRAEAPCRDTNAILQACAAMTKSAANDVFAALSTRSETAKTAGERLYLEHGLRGIRGEVAEGLPAVSETALPTFRRALDAGFSRNDAGVYALLALIARGTDTNMVSRGGIVLAKAAADEAALLLRSGFPTMAQIEALDRSFIAQNLSPGGCADLLAVAYFLDAWQHA